MAGVPIDPAADVAAVFDGTDEVTIYRLDADDGSTLETASGIPAHRSATRDADFPTQGGDTGADECDWLVCMLGGLAFTPQARDEIEEPDGTRWVVAEVKTDGNLHWCQGCVRSR